MTAARMQARANTEGSAPIQLGVLVSGSGSNLQAILDAIADGSLNAEVKVVISNRPGVLALERAANAGVTALAIPHKNFATREDFDRALVTTLRENGVDWIVLAGFMRVLTVEFLRAFSGRIINIHPALLPAFPGVEAIQQALDYGVKITGCTVHYVELGVDLGKIIAQRAVAIEPGDDLASLSARVHEAEHALLVSVLGEIAAGKVTPLANARNEV
ncbi:MAG TPA: phosphoribosylglycinamide formyltransferase [Polyangiaceae bacterium]|jgi:phosphoribosylglycinamide formyltransferase-1|nr:phosphoribosylglycinamide formyltransferase [Polyangiaceae bacterium]